MSFEASVVAVVVTWLWLIPRAVYLAQTLIPQVTMANVVTWALIIFAMGSAWAAATASIKALNQKLDDHQSTTSKNLERIDGSLKEIRETYVLIKTDELKEQITDLRIKHVEKEVNELRKANPGTVPGE